VVVTIIFCTFCSKLHQDIRFNKTFLTSFHDKKYILEISLSIFLVLFLVTLSLHTTYAQPSTNKNAIVFWGVHIYDSHDFWGCGDWNLYAELNRPFTWTVVLDYCVDQDNTYGVIPRVAIVTEYTSDQKPKLWLFGTEEDGWLGLEFLHVTNFQISNPPFGYFTFIIPSGFIDGARYDSTDYWTGFDLIDCHSSVGQSLQICNLPPGRYYKWADEEFWTYGVPPDPDLGGCGWPFC
jgi:hypothetical protein